MFWCHHNRDRPFKATPKYLLAILFETLSVRAEIRNTYRTCGYGSILIIVSQEKKMRDPSCDVSFISTNIQDGGQLMISNENISRKKADIEICNRLLYNVLESRYSLLKRDSPLDCPTI